MATLANTLLGMLAAISLILLAPFARAADRVLIVSIDALHPEALTKTVAPNLYTLMQSGRYTLDGRSVDPPKTLIAHTAMFTGLTPSQSGKRDNEWLPGDSVIDETTLFDDAKKSGYRTAFFYSKPKLGFLVNSAIDAHALDPLGGIKQSAEALNSIGKTLVLLHLSGLEYAGADSGWLSPDYLTELTAIDRALVPLFEQLRSSTSFAIIVTSDHGGHEKLHGTQHADDYKLPLIMLSDTADAHSALALPTETWPITNLRKLVGKFLDKGTPPVHLR